MREIKFRFWNNIVGRMSKEYTLKELHDQEVNFNLLQPLQYTGLKDKNDKEIFEGDIIETPKGKAEVTFRIGCFYVSTASNYRLGGWSQDSIEIIGNKYENKSLI